MIPLVPPLPCVSMTTPPLAQPPPPQAQAARDVNTASLCRIGQETVQDIVLRTMEIFQLLRNMQVRECGERQEVTISNRQGGITHFLFYICPYGEHKTGLDICNSDFLMQTGQMLVENCLPTLFPILYLE